MAGHRKKKKYNKGREWSQPLIVIKEEEKVSENQDKDNIQAQNQIRRRRDGTNLRAEKINTSAEHYNSILTKVKLGYQGEKSPKERDLVNGRSLSNNELLNLQASNKGDVPNYEITTAATAIATPNRLYANIKNAGQILSDLTAFVKEVKALGFDNAEIDITNKSKLPTQVIPNPHTTSPVLQTAFPNQYGKYLEIVKIPKTNIQKGDELLSRRDYIRAFVEGINRYKENLSMNSIRLRNYPTLMTAEMDQPNRFCLINLGVTIPGAFVNRVQMQQNMICEPIIPFINKWYWDKLNQAGFSPSKVDKSMRSIKSLTLRKHTHTGSFPFSSATDPIRNTVAVAVAIATALRIMVNKDITLEQVGEIFKREANAYFPWTAHLPGGRISPTGKVQGVYLSTAKGSSLLCGIKGIAGKPRSINMCNSILKASNKFLSRALSEYMYTFAINGFNPHPRDPIANLERYRNNKKKGLVAVSIDYTGYDETLGPTYQNNFMTHISQEGTVLRQALETEINAPVIGPARYDLPDVVAHRYENKGYMLSSGMSYTSLIGSVTNVQLLAESLYLIDSVYYHPDKYGINFDFWVFSDDSVIFLPKSRIAKDIDKLASHLTKKGFRIKQDVSGAIFLMRVYEDKFSTNIIGRMTQSFFQSEREKIDPGIVSLMVYSHASLIDNNHPMKAEYVKSMDITLGKYKFALHTSVKDVMNWFGTDEQKKYVQEYAEKSEANANEFFHWMNALTQGAFVQGDEIEFVEKLLGFRFVPPKIEVDLNFFSKEMVLESLNAFAVMAKDPKNVEYLTNFKKKFSIKDDYKHENIRNNPHDS